jgi:hypothetical protein
MGERQTSSKVTAARLRIEFRDGDDVIGGNAVLLAAGLDHCEHRSDPCSIQVSAGRGPGFFAAGDIPAANRQNDERAGSESPRVNGRE